MTRGCAGWGALLCLLASGAACAAPKGEGAVTMKLECALTVAPQVRAGEPVVLHFRLTNRSAKRLFVLNWHTPLEGLLSGYLQVTRDGASVPYQGPKVKRGDPEADEYVALAPGASAEAEVEASLAYELRQPGRYLIAFAGRLMDVTEKEAEVPRPLARHRAVNVRCPAVATTVVPP